MKSPAERQADKRQRRKEAGEVLVQKWVPVNSLEEVIAAMDVVLHKLHTDLRKVDEMENNQGRDNPTLDVIR